jgi:RNA polymerase sigma-70 factor (ECF subfamily)
MPHGPDGTSMEAGTPGGRTFEARSFETWIMALLPDLRRYARSLSASDADGEDLLQDGVERLLTARTSWSGTNFRGWAMTILTNLYRNGTRRERRFPFVDIDEVLQLPESAPMGDPLERARLQRALDRLSPDFRATLMLVVVEGHSYAEVAEITRAPIGTVMSRLSRARAEIARYLEEDNILPLRRSE